MAVEIPSNVEQYLLDYRIRELQERADDDADPMEQYIRRMSGLGAQTWNFEGPEACAPLFPKNTPNVQLAGSSLVRGYKPGRALKAFPDDGSVLDALSEFREQAKALTGDAGTDAVLAASSLVRKNPSRENLTVLFRLLNGVSREEPPAQPGSGWLAQQQLLLRRSLYDVQSLEHRRKLRNGFLSSLPDLSRPLEAGDVPEGLLPPLTSHLRYYYPRVQSQGEYFYPNLKILLHSFTSDPARTAVLPLAVFLAVLVHKDALISMPDFSSFPAEKLWEHCEFSMEDDRWHRTRVDNAMQFFSNVATSERRIKGVSLEMCCMGMSLTTNLMDWFYRYLPGDTTTTVLPFIPPLAEWYDTRGFGAGGSWHARLTLPQTFGISRAEFDRAHAKFRNTADWDFLAAILVREQDAVSEAVRTGQDMRSLCENLLSRLPSRGAGGQKRELLLCSVECTVQKMMDSFRKPEVLSALQYAIDGGDAPK